MVFHSPFQPQHENLLLAEVVKMVFSAYMVAGNIPKEETLAHRFRHLTRKSWKMFALALMYGCMNILSYVLLRYIGAGLFANFCAVQNLRDGNLFVDFITEKILTGPMESIDCAHDGYPAVFGTNLE